MPALSPAARDSGYQSDEVLEQEAPARTAALTLEEERGIDADILLPKVRLGKPIVAAKKLNCYIARLNLGQFQKYNHVKVEGDD